MKDDLGDRIKKYEDSYRFKLPCRLPVIVRCDGKSFHSLTKGCKKPFDEDLIDCMNETAIYICKNVQGCKLAYTQSDEISLLITNYENNNTESYFDNNLQKMVSVIAGLASSYFTSISHKVFGKTKLACFDSRAFILPKEEVCNYFIWRMNDCTRNSVQMLSRSLYSHKECHNKNNSELQEMCFQKGINWNDLPIYQKRGRCIIKNKVIKDGVNPKTGKVLPSERNEWQVDNNIPIFSQDRNYVERFI